MEMTHMYVPLFGSTMVSFLNRVSQSETARRWEHQGVRQCT
jgi:hypothetical protein